MAMNTRLSVSTITDDELDALYDQLDEANRTIAEFGNAYQVLKDRHRAYVGEIGDLFERVADLERLTTGGAKAARDLWAELEAAMREAIEVS